MTKEIMNLKLKSVLMMMTNLNGILKIKFSLV